MTSKRLASNRRKAETVAAALGKASVPGRGHLATTADLYRVAPAIVVVSSGVMFGFLKFFLP